MMGNIIYFTADDLRVFYIYARQNITVKAKYHRLPSL